MVAGIAIVAIPIAIPIVMVVVGLCCVPLLLNELAFLEQTA